VLAYLPRHAWPHRSWAELERPIATVWQGLHPERSLAKRGVSAGRLVIMLAWRPA